MISSIAKLILPPGTTRVLWRDMNDPWIIDSRYGKSTFLDAAEADHHKTLVQARDCLGTEWVGGIDRRDPLEVDMGTGELRRDVVEVVVHRAHDRLHYRFAGMATIPGIPDDLLDPLEVDNRHHANQQVDMLGRIDLSIDHTTV